MKTIATLTIAALAILGTVPAVAADDQHAQEAQIGAQVYQQLQQKGEIIPRTQDAQYYAMLDPIAKRIAATANPQYDFPFEFILVHEKQPNAFAVPGGHVYVTDSLMKFVQNREELAGVLCHETSHDIHHDVVHNNAKDQTTGSIIGIIGALTGISNSGLGQMAESGIYTLQSDHFSREVETAADRKGSETCAQSNFNPWGMVWLFQNFEKADTGGSMEALSDHPNDAHRIEALEKHFGEEPSLFGRFSSDIASATPLGTTTTATNPTSERRLGVPVARRTTPNRGSFCCAPANNPAASTPAASPSPPPDVTIIHGN